VNLRKQEFAGWLKMPSRPKSLCRGCKTIIDKPGYCSKCQPKHQRLLDARRGTAHQRGYTAEFQRRSKAFRNKPENQFCVLRLPGCTEFTEVTDHIKPVPPDHPLFMDESNWQPLCRHCNSVKGRREMRGER
jgi:5-methylcytosine-specific restriction protein A